MDQFYITFISLILTVLLGHILKLDKLNFLKQKDMDCLNTIVINVTLPCLIFLNLSNVNSNLYNQLTILPIIAITTGILCLVIAYIVLTSLKIDKIQKWSLLITVIFGQTTFLGFPLVLDVYGQANLVRAIFFDISSYITFAYISIILMLIFGEGLKKPLKKILTLPIIWSIILGIIFSIFNIKIGLVFHDTISFLADATTPIAMLVLGLSLNFSSLIKNFKISLIMSIIKLIIFPVICFIFLTILNINSMNFNISIIEAIVPCGIITIVLSINYNLDYQLTVDTIFLSTLLSFITIPIMIILIKGACQFFS